MEAKEWTTPGYNTQLGLSFLHAHFVQHAYPRHSHDYYVISLIERGRQSFIHRGRRHLTAPGGVILINPDAVHTGEAVDANGFEMRSIYPTAKHMQMAHLELTGRQYDLPYFKEVRVDHLPVKRSILSLHQALSEGADELECESRLLSTLGLLIRRYAEVYAAEKAPGNDRRAVRRARDYINEHFAHGVRLHDLAAYVSLSPYYLLRVFHAEVGMPPYAYLESLRVRQAQRLIESGKPLADVAVEVGFSSQSHMTRRFKRIIGATPGQYAAQIRD